MSDTVIVDEIVIPIVVDYLEEDEVYQISCPWLQGCQAWGETLDETMHAIPGNIRAMIQARCDTGFPLPSRLERVNLQRPFTLRMAPARDTANWAIK